MNWGRGFFRVWLVASILWAALIFGLGSPRLVKTPIWQLLPTIADGWAAQNELADAENAVVIARNNAKENTDLIPKDLPFARYMSDEEVEAESNLALVTTRIERGEHVTNGATLLGWIAAIPSIILLILGSAIGWAVSGFRK